MRILNYYWRVFATGFCFACFGLGGLLMPLIMMPSMLLIRDAAQRERFCKKLVHRGFKFFMDLMQFMGVLVYSISADDIKKLQRPGQLILANHPTLIDVVFLIALMPRGDCVVKSSLLRNPFTRGPVGAAQYIANDSAEKVVEAAGASFQRGNSLVVFPEGTRTVPGRDVKLQRGAANIAIRNANNITPVIIKCVPPTLSKYEPWYQIPSRRVHISLRVEDEIDVSPYLNEPPSVAARRLSKYLQEYFTEEISQNERTGTNA